MYQSIYDVPKTSDTQADDLVAHGFCRVLDELIPRQYHSGPTMTEAGGFIRITLPDGLQVEPEWVANFPPEVNPLPFIQTSKEKPPKGFAPVRNADEEWAQFKSYTNSQNNPEVDKPKADFWVVAYLSDFRMQGLSAYNSLARQWWETRSQRIQQLETILQLFTTPNPTHQDAIVARWTQAMKKAKVNVTPTVTASQLFNPHTGKGQNRPKADAVLLPGNEKSFWLLEYLKALGMYAGAEPRTVRGGDTRKTYVLSPLQLRFRAHTAIFKEFRESLWNETAIKMDIITSLRYVQVFLNYVSLANDPAVDDDDWFTPEPRNYVRGFYVTTYQKLSANAYTMMNQAFIGLPVWAKVSDSWEQSHLQEALQEHIERIRSLDESRSEEYALLQLYRDFISADQWDKFFDFTAAYGRFLLGQLERKNFYIKPFSEKNMWRLLMSNTNYADILQNPGFQNVAKAIRLSTIVPQYLGRRDSLYEVRYGLGQTFKKSAHYKEDFLTTLADFMHSYNEENALKQERHGKSFRANLTKTDVEAMVQLIDRHDPQLICNLLLAYGFARDPKETEPNQTTEEM
jgi:hypothetical protein